MYLCIYIYIWDFAVIMTILRFWEIPRDHGSGFFLGRFHQNIDGHVGKWQKHHSGSKNIHQNDGQTDYVRRFTCPLGPLGYFCFSHLRFFDKSLDNHISGLRSWGFWGVAMFNMNPRVSDSPLDAPRDFKTYCQQADRGSSGGWYRGNPRWSVWIPTSLQPHWNDT